MAKSRKPRDWSDVEIAQLHTPCPGCGSSDALTIYTDGHGFCFAEDKLYSKRQLNGSGTRNDTRSDSGRSDSHRGSVAGELAQPLSMALEEYLGTAEAHPIKSRGITLATCKKWNYLIRRLPKGGHEQIAVYYDPKTKHPETCKVRTEDKAFFWEGPTVKRGRRLYGQQLWGTGGKSLTITEGELDALSVSQVFDHKYPVVSVPNGAPQAAKAVAANLEWVNSFDKVVFMFDMDQPGRDAAQECAKLLPPGKAFIAILPEKDANACLMEGKGAEITRAFWNAQAWRPDGIIDARTLTALCLNPVVTGLPWPWEFMTKWTYGRRPGELYVYGGGTGIGKTDFLAEIIADTISGTTRDLHASFAPEGFVAFTYETGPVLLKKSIAGKLAKRRFHIPRDPDSPQWTEEELRDVMDYMDVTLWEGGGKFFVNKNGGSADWEAVKDRSRYLVHAEGVKHISVDPISALVLGEDDERKLLDKLIMEAALLSQELECSIYMASHLARPQNGPSHEEGGRVALNQFRGSNGIVMWANYCFGLERNQQAEEPVERTKTVVRCLKDRYTGDSTGKTQALYYDTLAGTLDVPVSSNTLEVPALDAPNAIHA